MGILQAPTQLAGTPGIKPNFKYMTTTDSYATITAAGYLNQPSLEVTPVGQGDVIQCLYSVTIPAGTSTYGVFTVSIAAGTGIITLVPWGGDSGVVLPTIANHIATYTNTTGTIGEDAATAINGGNIQAGLSGTAGTVASFPATASKGSLVLAAVANTGNTVTTISNVAMGQASVVSIPDPGAATADFVVAPAALVSGNLIQASGTAGLVADAGIATTNVMSKIASNVLSGAGQITLAKVNGTEATNAVTASGNAGVITTSSLTTAGGATYAITWTNTKITATSVFTFCIQGGTNTTQNITFTCVPGTGTATLTIYNNTAATALNGTILIGYTVL
jgi:hypothetical protein